MQMSFIGISLVSSGWHFVKWSDKVSILLSGKCKVIKINLRITAKCHAHLHTLTKTHAKFQKDPAKTVGGVAFTRYPVYTYMI